MAKLIEFQAATAEGPRAKTGYVAWLNVRGKGRHKFVLQVNPVSGDPSILADYRSGYKLADMAGAAVAHYVGRGIAPAWRTLAQWTIEDIEAKHGSVKLISELARPATLNA